MKDRITFLLNRIGERLWVKPLLMCVMSIAAVFVAKMADETRLGARVPEITVDLLETLLTIMSSSMLVIATFAVASMVSSYASASSTATPRSFPLVIADDVSQNALSTFIGAFIFSIVAIIVLKSGYFDKASRFALFVLTLIVFATVILTFVRWVDRIARLGRLGATIDKVEAAAAKALLKRKRAPTMGCASMDSERADGEAVFGESIGYLQRIDVAGLQKIGEESGVRIRVAALPGTFVVPDRPLACLLADGADSTPVDRARLRKAFVVGDERTFDEDPRFGLIVLSEIASRALSPAVNDPGTAIDVIGTFVRLFEIWCRPLEQDDMPAVEFDRVIVQAVSIDDMFDDAFTAIARDGAGAVEVAGRLQKALRTLAAMGDAATRRAAKRHARQALARAESALELAEDVQTVRALADFADSGDGAREESSSRSQSAGVSADVQ